MPDLYRYVPGELKTDSQKRVAKQFEGRKLEILNGNDAVVNVIDRFDQSVPYGKVFSSVPVDRLRRIQ